MHRPASLHDAAAARRDPRFGAFAEAFDSGLYFEAHELLEALWRDYDGADRRFWQGLVQAAVALEHCRRGNAAGARTVGERACRNLEAFAPRHAGLDVETLVVATRAAVAGEAARPTIAGVDLDARPGEPR